MHPTERLVNLVALLLDARRPLTFEAIRELLPAYAQDDVATAKRMFERDKDLLRDIGIPVEVVPTDVWEVEQGYVIPNEKYYLQEIAFTPEEVSALLVATRTAGEDASVELAVRKLLYGVDGGVLVGLAGSPIVAGPEAGTGWLTTLAEAISGQRAIRFGYRTAKGTLSERTVDPYGLVCRGGHWYVVGLDRERREIRAFRISRVRGGVDEAGAASAPPDGFHAAEHVQAGPWGTGEAVAHARLAFSPDVAWWATGGVPGAEALKTRRDGWVEVRVPLGPTDELAAWILSFGPDAKVLSPASLRAEVVRRLESALAAL